MDALEQYVRQEVADWFEQVLDRSPEPDEIEQITVAVTRLADDFIGTQILNACS